MNGANIDGRAVRVDFSQEKERPPMRRHDRD